jgi:hypothetical protein
VVSQSQTKPREWAKLSPFTAVKPGSNSLIVRFNKGEYELVSINNQSVPDIFDFCRRTYGDWWEKRFAVDRVEVLAGMDYPMTPYKTVKLILKDVESGRRKTVYNAPMTRANRQAACLFRNSGPN